MYARARTAAPPRPLPTKHCAHANTHKTANTNTHKQTNNKPVVALELDVAHEVEAVALALELLRELLRDVDEVALDRAGRVLHGELQLRAARLPVLARLDQKVGVEREHGRVVGEARHAAADDELAERRRRRVGHAVEVPLARDARELLDLVLFLFCLFVVSF